MGLWECKPLKVYGSRMSESLLAILCHILRGEAVVKERLEKEKAEEAAAATTSEATTSAIASVPASGPTSASVSSALGSSRLLGDSGLFDAAGLLGRSRPRPEPNEEHVQQVRPRMEITEP